MTDESNSNADDEDSPDKPAEEIDEEPGAGLGPTADMDKADPVEEEKENQTTEDEEAEDDAGSSEEPGEG